MATPLSLSSRHGLRRPCKVSRSMLSVWYGVSPAGMARPNRLAHDALYLARHPRATPGGAAPGQPAVTGMRRALRWARRGIQIRA